jgi:hypothetical protein
MTGCHDILPHLTRLLGTANDIVYRTIAVEILGNLCTHGDWNRHQQIVKESLLPKLSLLPEWFWRPPSPLCYS